MGQIVCSDKQCKISGLVSFANVMALYQDFCTAIKSFAADSVQVDLAELDCADSSIVACLVLAQNFGRKQHKAVYYQNCPQKLEQIIKLCDLDFLLQAH